MTDEPTTRELDRRFDRLEKSIEAGFGKIEARLDRMVSGEMFALFQSAVDQRLSKVETSASAAEERCCSRKDHLQAEIDQVEQARAEDRRMVIKAAIAAAATLIAAIVTVLLPLFL